mmetsp:Transcript_35884/g.94187  ORF Transcript_35884/g.94187 Transcript_35884/m.94187 type:complete len:229 (+) Transcript_35884:576-1262(+)
MSTDGFIRRKPCPPQFHTNSMFRRPRTAGSCHWELPRRRRSSSDISTYTACSSGASSRHISCPRVSTFPGPAGSVRRTPRRLNVSVGDSPSPASPPRFSWQNMMKGLRGRRDADAEAGSPPCLLVSAALPPLVPLAVVPVSARLFSTDTVAAALLTLPLSPAAAPRALLPGILVEGAALPEERAEARLRARASALRSKSGRTSSRVSSCADASSISSGSFTVTFRHSA